MEEKNPVIPAQNAQQPQSGQPTEIQTPPVTPTVKPVPGIPVTAEQAPVATPNQNVYASAPSTQSDWKFSALISVLIVLVLGIGGYFIYRQYRIVQAPVSIGGVVELDGPEVVADESSTAFDYTTVQNIPPEGETPAVSNPTAPPVPMERYDNYQYQFSFSYRFDPKYQRFSCPGPSPSMPNIVKKEVFFDSSKFANGLTPDELCSPNYVDHYAKIMFSEETVNCLGEAATRIVAGSEAIQCAGKTNSVSSQDTSTSLLIPKSGGTILIEINSPDYIELLSDAIDSFAFETQEPPPLVESD